MEEKRVVGLANHTLLVRRDGSETPIDDSAAPILDPDGALVGVVLVFRDVAVRRREELWREYLARATEELNSSLDYQRTLATVARLAVPRIADWCAVDMREGDELRRLAVAHIDPQRIAFVQEIQSRYPPDRGSGTWEVLRTGRPQWVAQITDEMLVAAARDAEHLRLARQLQLRSYVAVPIERRGEPVGVLSFAMAESGREHDEEDVALAVALADRASVALEKAWLFDAQVAAREQQEQARAQADAANRAKDEFLAILGHELRNPLAPMQTALQLIAMRGVTGIDREREILERQVKHLTRLVDDLLDVARITRGDVRIAAEPVDLADVVARSVEMVMPLLERASHELTVDAPAGSWVRGDPERLAQVAANLLTNAARYTSDRGRIDVEVAREGDSLVLRVRDTGRGIRADMLEKVFEPFVQDKRGPDRAGGGLGLGLAIASRLAEGMGGRLVAHSAGEGRGSTFEARLPACPAPDAEAHPTEADPLRASRRARLLVVDDNDDARRSMVLALSWAGFEVIEAADGPSALTVAARRPPRVAVLDIGLPVMDGYELARRFREAFPACRLIALTGYGQERDRSRALSVGFSDHLVKPVEIEVLIDRIEQLVDTAH